LILIATQASVYFVYIGFAVSMQLAPTTSRMLQHWGLFPWPMGILLGVGLGWVAYVQRQTGIFSATIAPLLHNTQESNLGLSIDFGMRSAPIISFSSLMAFTTLALTTWAGEHWQLPITSGINLGTLVVATFFLLAPMSQPWQQIIRFFTTHNIPPAVIALLLLLILIPLLLLSSQLAAIINHYLPFTGFADTIKIDSSSENQHQLWMIFSASWWLIWMPVMAGFIATISRGYCIRTIVAGSLLLPIIAALVSPLSKALPPTIAYLLMILGLVMLLLLFFRYPYMTHYLRARIPDTLPMKTRQPHFFLRNILNAYVMSIALLLPLGLLFLSVGFYMLLMPILWISVVSAAATLISVLSATKSTNNA